MGGSPVGCLLGLWIQITDAGAGNGLFTEVDLTSSPGYFFSPSVPLNWNAELVAQGVSDVNFFFNAPGPSGSAPFQMKTDGGTDLFTIVSLTPGGDPNPPNPEPEPVVEFPFAVDSQKCADAIGKAGAGYWTARHKSLAACRSDFMAGNPVYSDKSKTTVIEAPSGCPSEVKASAAIARARVKVRATIAKRCTDALLADLFACGDTVNALADATGATGCVIEAIDASVDDALETEFGF
jgi:hypothetical protein